MYIVATMYVDTSTIKRGDKVYTRHLLRESYRNGKSVLHCTIANLSHCSEAEIGAIRLALRHKHELEKLGTMAESVIFKQGLSFGAVWMVYQVAIKLGIVEALGSDRDGKLALWQVIARVIDQGSRLSAVRLATSHAACEVLGLGGFNEDSLYENLDWIAEEQPRIEKELFAARKKKISSNLFLYDVTSSYFEGEHNELAAFGYNRDGKKGKKQIVIGLLCDEEGHPIAIEVFPGNTQDTKTFASQIQKIKDRFGVTDVTFVGDRGMIKSQQMEDLADQGFHYITAITKPQIEKLLKEKVLQIGLFDQNIGEVIINGGIRYILKRNPIRAKEVAASRESKLRKLQEEAQKRSDYLESHPRADPQCALKKVQALATRLKIEPWIVASLIERRIAITVDDQILQDIAKLDGCYVLKTDLSSIQATKEVIHDRYKDLAMVEQTFRSSKTIHLNIRPIYLQLEQRTRAHALVVMLAYKIIQHLANCWVQFDCTVEEGIQALSTLCLVEVSVKNSTAYHQVPTPRNSVAELFRAADVKLPRVINAVAATVSTKKKLSSRRIRS